MKTSKWNEVGLSVSKMPKHCWWPQKQYYLNLQNSLRADRCIQRFGGKSWRPKHRWDSGLDFSDCWRFVNHVRNYYILKDFTPWSYILQAILNSTVLCVQYITPRKCACFNMPLTLLMAQAMFVANYLK